ncbi:putative phosphatase regulatory subunit-domain-containing protein [Parasitella parasitica]|nr:putative phosphatase regulatory subunit-domain-containing protein [Parasitella parasitica]
MSTTSNPHHFLYVPQQQQQQQDMSHKRVALIKRPPLVRSCSPNPSEDLHRTASNASLNRHYRKPKKSVRFCDNASLENVRLFLKTQMPKACRSDPACLKKQYTFRIRRPNWPSSAMAKRHNDGGSAVRLEDVQLLMQQQEQQQQNLITLLGSVQVANLAFQKRVIVRYTLDDWNTVKQVDAQYQEPVAHSANTWDRFSFKIVLNANTHAAHESLYLAVKYTVAGKEFWDNNNQNNYQVDIVPDVELDMSSSSSSSSSSDDDDDDDHIFEDCITHDEEEDAIQELQDKLKLANLKERYSLNSAPIQKPWSPPLSPTTPADTTPLWISTSNNNSKSSNGSDSSNYFVAKTPTAATAPAKEQPTPNGNDTAGQFHNLIHKYCFYNDHKRASIFTPYHSDPPRCSSPTPRAIRS